MGSVYINMQTGEETESYEVARLWYMSGASVSVCLEGRFQVSCWNHENRPQNHRRRISPEFMALLAEL